MYILPKTPKDQMPCSPPSFSACLILALKIEKTDEIIMEAI